MKFLLKVGQKCGIVHSHRFEEFLRIHIQGLLCDSFTDFSQQDETYIAIHEIMPDGVVQTAVIDPIHDIRLVLGKGGRRIRQQASIMQQQILESRGFFSMVGVFRDVLCDEIVDVNYASVYEMHDTRKRCGDLGQRGDVEYRLISEGRRAERQIIVGETAERQTINGLRGVGNPQHSPRKPSILQIVVNSIGNLRPVISPQRYEQKQQSQNSNHD